MFKFIKVHLERHFLKAKSLNIRRVDVVRIFLAAAIIFSFSCGRKANTSSPVVARVGDAMLTLDDIKNSFPSKPGIEISKVQIEFFVQRWIESELVYNEALRQNFNNNPVIQKRISNLAKEYVATLFLEQYLGQDLDATEEELQRFFQENASEFIRSEDLYHVRLILVSSFREANIIKSSLQVGQDFEVLARTQSIDGSKEQGGDLGWVPSTALLPELARMVPSMPLGQISQPVRTDLGYYLLQVLDSRKKGEVQSLEEVKEIIAWRIKAQKRQSEYRNLISRLTEKADVRTDSNLMETVVEDVTLK
jgi:hypothetical protein